MVVAMLTPLPRVARLGDGEFHFSNQSAIDADPGLEGVASWLRGAVGPATGLVLPPGGEGADIRLRVDSSVPAEGFRLEISTTTVTVSGADSAGVFYGCQALRQLMPPATYRRARVEGVEWIVPAIVVEDAPAFGWRGAMLDVVRHFMPKNDLLRFIDLMAMHRLNRLHLHLTDDQGWRIEILRYPRLTEVASWRHESQVGAGPTAGFDGRPHGGYYSQDDIREIVAYAAERFITVVPEIESPGHVQAALAAYPQLGVTGETLDVSPRWGIIPNVLNLEDSTVEFFRDVLDEVMDLFPSAYIGIGGDECPKDQWRADARTQQRMRELGLATEDELQSWFVRQLDEHITARGRRLFGWDEILEGGLAPGATVASWRGMTGAVAAARAGHDVIACPDDQVYLDYRQSELDSEPIPVSIVLTLEDVYAFDPVPAELTPDEARHVLGGQANVWTEHMDSPRTVDYFAFPRLCALAEAVWTGGERDFADFERRLEQHLLRLDALGVEYRHADGPLPWQRRPGVPGRPSTREARAAHIAQLVATIT